MAGLQQQERLLRTTFPAASDVEPMGQRRAPLALFALVVAPRPTRCSGPRSASASTAPAPGSPAPERAPLAGCRLAEFGGVMVALRLRARPPLATNARTPVPGGLHRGGEALGVRLLGPSRLVHVLSPSSPHPNYAIQRSLPPGTVTSPACGGLSQPTSEARLHGTKRSPTAPGQAWLAHVPRRVTARRTRGAR